MRGVFAAIIGFVLVLAPMAADARVGNGLSFGSRGARTYSVPPGTNTSPFGAAPMQRSMTPSGPSYGSNLPGGGYGRSYGMRPGSAFRSGLLGGLLGAGIGGMLFGGGFFGGMHGGTGVLGLLLQMFLLYLLASWAYRRFAGGPVPAGSGMFGRMMPGGFFGSSSKPAGPGMFGGGRTGRPITIGPADYQAFDRMLHEVQAGWSAHDVRALQQLSTPEMASIFGEQLAEQSSRGVRNLVRDVRLQQGDLSEAWAEGTREYATVAMQFSMTDVTVDSGGRVVDGSPTERMTVTEIWTFLRVPGGNWILSAIQQPR